jgi:hypothetical protein
VQIKNYIDQIKRSVKQSLVYMPFFTFEIEGKGTPSHNLVSMQTFLQMQSAKAAESESMMDSQVRSIGRVCALRLLCQHSPTRKKKVPVDDCFFV